MKRWLAALILVSCVSAASPPQHAALFKPEFQNEQVRVLRVRVGAHERIPMHDVPPHVAVWITDADLAIFRPDGSTEMQHFRAGDVTWVAIGKHAGENTGDKPIEFVAIEPLGR